MALENKLGDSETLKATKTGCLRRKLVISHLNERCGLQPEEGVVCGFIFSKESDLVLEITTNYEMQIPEDKFDDVLLNIREVFSLPNDTPPKWHLEPGVLDKGPDEYCIPSELFIPTTM